MSAIDSKQQIEALHATLGLADWPLEQIEQRFSADHHGDFARWADAVAKLPEGPMPWHCNGAVQIETKSGPEAFDPALRALHPWRKGPFKVGPLTIDTEWRSDWKWQRLYPHVDWQNKCVVDIGGGNGYFGWQMLHAGASCVLGVDPTLLFCMQHQAIQKLICHPRHWVIPLGIQELPGHAEFDIALSMGVIYHRRDPRAHLEHICGLVKPGGTVVLESIVAPTGFKPPDRYARMRNVWWIPSVGELQQWMQACGLEQPRCVDHSVTTVEEQRSTDWMRFESLAQALDPAQPNLTIEGHPAPARAIMVGQKPKTTFAPTSASS